MAHKITINLEVRGSREPELFAGLHAIPEVCREAVLRGLLELAIRTPSHLVAASARSAGEMFQRIAVDGDPSITKKLTFQSGRGDDHLLYAHFLQVPVGRRKQTVRALLMMGLLTQHAPQQDVAVQAIAPGQVDAGLHRQPEAISAPTQAEISDGASGADLIAARSTVSANVAAAVNNSDDLEDLFDAIPMKT